MSKKEWLKRARILEKELKELRLAKQEAFALACGGSANNSDVRVQTSRVNSEENKRIKFVEYDLLIDKQIDELVKCKTEILKAINGLKNDLYRTLLTAYYVNGETWEEVAKRMEYDIRHIHRLHGAALRNIEIF